MQVSARRALRAGWAAPAAGALVVGALVACAPVDGAGIDGAGAEGTGVDGSGVDGTSAERAADDPQAIDPDALVVTIGDSIMSGYGLDPDDAWPVLLSDVTGARVVNLACAGAGFVAVGDCGTDYAGLADEAIAMNPAVVIIQSSDNDVDQDRDDIRTGTADTLAQLRDDLPDATIVGIGTLWHLSPDEPASIGWSTEALESAVTDADGVFVSIGQPLRGHPDLLQWDGEHPNVLGQVVLSAAVREALARAGVDL